LEIICMQELYIKRRRKHTLKEKKHTPNQSEGSTRIHGPTSPVQQLTTHTRAYWTVSQVKETERRLLGVG
ncbi:hypothetical protein BAE44_0017040, partial [Dichanthelium oligosanthes]